MHPLKNTLALAVSCTALVTLANAALVITADDIVNNAYTFSISFDDLIDNSKFSDALYSSTNIAGATSEGSGEGERRYVTPQQGRTTASFVIAFDFSQAGYEITDFSIKDSIYINNTTTGTTIRGESLWTTDLADSGTQIRVTSSTGTSASTSGTRLWTLTESSSVVYYIVNFTATNTTFGTRNTQWDRGGPGSSNFEVTINLVPVPEPSSYALLASGVILGATLIWRRRPKQ